MNDTSTETRKPLGKVAYDAHGFYYRGPSWLNAATSEKKAFEAAAIAVRDVVLSELPGEWVLLPTNTPWQEGDERITRNFDWEPMPQMVNHGSLCRRRIRPAAPIGGLAELYQQPPAPASTFAPLAGPDITPPQTKEWTLPPPPSGREWHRTDWTQEMLPDGWRPLLKGELMGMDVEWQPHKTTDWENCGASDVGREIDTSHRFRTRRPLPSQAPEEQGKPHSDLITVNKFSSLLEIGALFPEADKWLTQVQVERAAITRERDKAIRENTRLSALVADKDMGDKAATDRAESAEARVKELEGELRIEKSHNETAEAEITRVKKLLFDQVQKCDAQHLTEIGLRAQLAKSSTWIPVSTPPSEKDGDASGMVLVTNGHGISVFTWRHVAGNPEQFTHWMPLPPLPPSVQSQEETMRKEFEARMIKEGNPSRRGVGSPDEYGDTSTQWAWENYLAGWQASRKGAQS